MKRFFAIMALCVAVVAVTTSCKKRGGEVLPAATDRGPISIEKFEGLERGKGLSGDILLSVSNGLRSDVTVIGGEIGIFLCEKRVATIVLNQEVALPKKVISSVRVPVSLKLEGSVIAYAVMTKLLRGELDNMFIALDAEAKVGAIRKQIHKDNIPMAEALKSVGIPAQGFKGLVL